MCKIRCGILFLVINKSPTQGGQGQKNAASRTNKQFIFLQTVNTAGVLNKIIPKRETGKIGQNAFLLK